MLIKNLIGRFKIGLGRQIEGKKTKEKGITRLQKVVITYVI